MRLGCHTGTLERSTFGFVKEMMIGRPSPSEVRKYALAVVLVVGMSVIKYGLGLVDPAILPFVIMTLPVLAAAWYGGWGPGLLATGLSLLAVLYVLPSGVPQLSPVSSVAFVAEGILISWLADQRHSERSQKRISREHLQLLYDGIDKCSLFMLDPTGRIEEWNQQAQAMFGYADADIRGKPLAWLYTEGDRDADEASRHLAHAKESGRLSVEGWRTRSDGTQFWADIQLTAIRDSKGSLLGYAHVVSDRTQRKQTEQELQEYRSRLEELVAERTHALHESMNRLRMSERMASLGTLSAGLGHDMGNLLLPVRLRLDAMHAKGIPDHLQDDIRAITTCADYLQRLANGLRLLSIDPAQSQATPPATDLVDWWKDVQPFLRNALPRRIELEKSMADDLPPVGIPRHVLTQAIFNLVQNAGHAIEPDVAGRVCVWAEKHADGQSVSIGVTDNGRGMSEEVRERCLEPFFTSKTRAISTGLGLTLVHGMVQQAGGTIAIDTELGKGTTFTLTLPIARQAQRRELSRGGRRVQAVVDISDNRMRTYLGAVLKSVGFEVSYGKPRNGEAQVCVAEPAVSPDSVKQFLQTDPQPRRWVILGRNPDVDLPPEVLLLGERPSPAEVREAFQRLAQDLTDKGSNGV